MRAAVVLKTVVELEGGSGDARGSDPWGGTGMGATDNNFPRGSGDRWRSSSSGGVRGMWWDNEILVVGR